MKKRFMILAIILIAALVFCGCSSSKGNGKEALEKYYNLMIAEEYKQAYDMISDFDKGNISEETFVNWCINSTKIIKNNSFEIDKKIDTFKDYKYLGTQFGTVYGYKITFDQKVLISDVDLHGYNMDVVRIMVMIENDESKILLLLTELDETVAAYQAYIDNSKK